MFFELSLMVHDFFFFFTSIITIEEGEILILDIIDTP